MKNSPIPHVSIILILPIEFSYKLSDQENMKWPQSPPFGYASSNYEAFTVIQRIEGFNIKQSDDEANQRFVVEIKWKGQFSFFGLRRKILMINLTEEGDEVGDGVVQWNNQGFHYSGHLFPWELHFTIFNVSLFFFSLSLLYLLNLISFDFCFEYE